MATPTLRREKAKNISVRIQPTIGPSFTLSVSPSAKVSSLKESISDRMGLSPQKMTLLLHTSELDSGTLGENEIQDGSEIRLVPAVESGVTLYMSHVPPPAKLDLSGHKKVDHRCTTCVPINATFDDVNCQLAWFYCFRKTANSVDPVAMMKHSMSGISDQQIDDFLNGKSPLSVAIRVGESVVVVNLHRAKVEEIDDEPPPPKRRCFRARRLSEDSGFCEPTPTPSPTRSHGGIHHHLNTNSDEGMDSGVLDQSFLSNEGASSYGRTSSIGVDSVDEPSSSSSLRSRSIHSEPRLPDNGISMKRKAVMEAIGEILKKMYASSEKGRLPGSFKGRFSSEFTCDSDMSEILHSKTTMTSCGNESDSRKDGSKNSTDSSDQTMHEAAASSSKSKFEENKQLKEKVARLKWKMQQQRAVKLAKRKGEKSPCGWMEALDIKFPEAALKSSEQPGFCGFKRGFLLSQK